MAAKPIKSQLTDRSALEATDFAAQDAAILSSGETEAAPRKMLYPGDRRVLDGFFRLSSDMLCIMAQDGVFQRLNPAFERVLGYNEKELLAQSLLEIVHPEDKETTAEALRSLQNGEQADDQILSLENRCSCKDGSFRWLVWNLAADAPQQLIYAVVHDVTKRREVEENTRRTDKFLTSIVENIPHMIFVKDAENLRFVRINKAEEEMMGMSQEQMLGKNDYDFFPVEEADFFTKADRAVLNSGQLLDVPEETVHCAKGTRIFHTKKIPIFDNEGKPQYLLGISEDITEYKQAEQALRERNTRMQADLDLARAMQEAFIVAQAPRMSECIPGAQSALSFHHCYIPDTTLGGDFFHITALSETCAGVFICDVMGHGVRSALVTAMIRALVSEKTASAANPGAFLTEINRHLHGILEQAQTPMFASALYLVADTASGQLSYANAGHPSPLRLSRKRKFVEQLIKPGSATGPALGIFEDAVYQSVNSKLEENDLFVLFTDGVFEVQGHNEEFGEERLISSFHNHMDLPVDAMIEQLLKEIRNFSLSGEFADDVCLVGVNINNRLH